MIVYVVIMYGVSMYGVSTYAGLGHITQTYLVRNDCLCSHYVWSDYVWSEYVCRFGKRYTDIPSEEWLPMYYLCIIYVLSIIYEVIIYGVIIYGVSTYAGLGHVTQTYLHLSVGNCAAEIGSRMNTGPVRYWPMQSTACTPACLHWKPVPVLPSKTLPYLHCLWCDASS